MEMLNYVYESTGSEWKIGAYKALKPDPDSGLSFDFHIIESERAGTGLYI